LESLLSGFDETESEMVHLALEGYSLSEIAPRVGCSRFTVRRVLDRIGRRLCGRLGKNSDQ
jgi:DNA-directed RNA polymerase specialized sigma24 family protein